MLCTLLVELGVCERSPPSAKLTPKKPSGGTKGLKNHAVRHGGVMELVGVRHMSTEIRTYMHHADGFELRITT